VSDNDAYRIVAQLCDRPDPIIIDGGAHKGDTVLGFSHFLPQAEFHCFEPDMLLVNELTATFRDNDNVHVIKAALGQMIGKSMFHINVSRPTNSLLPIADGLQSDLMELCKLVGQVEVDVTTIDEYCRSKGLTQVDIVKLDLQGYDYQALQGARTTLERSRIVLVEVLFTEIYKGAGLFPDILGLLRGSGFDLYTLCGLQYGNESKLLWANAIFFKDIKRKNNICQPRYSI